MPVAMSTSGTAVADASSEAVRRLLLAELQVAVNVGAVGTQYGVRVDGHVVAQLLDHGRELGVVLEVSVPAVQALVVDTLELAPDPLLRVETGGVTWLVTVVEPAALLLRLVAVVSLKVVHDEVGPRAVRVTQSAGQSDEEALGLFVGRASSNHVELATLQRLAYCAKEGH